MGREARTRLQRQTMDPQTFAAVYYPGSTRIAPGIWRDAAGDIHWSIPELLALVDLEDTPANRAAVLKIALAAIPDALGPTVIITDATEIPPTKP